MRWFAALFPCLNQGDEPVEILPECLHLVFPQLQDEMRVASPDLSVLVDGVSRPFHVRLIRMLLHGLVDSSRELISFTGIEVPELPVESSEIVCVAGVPTCLPQSAFEKQFKPLFEEERCRLSVAECRWL